MTAAAPEAAFLSVCLVTLVVGEPSMPLGPEDTGGKSRWWLQVVPRGGSVRGRDGVKGRAKRPPLPNRGFVVFPNPTDPRRTALRECTFECELAPGERYTLGVGCNRLPLVVPYDVQPGAVCTVTPTSPGEADVVWSTPSAAIPF